MTYRALNGTFHLPKFVHEVPFTHEQIDTSSHNYIYLEYGYIYTGFTPILAHLGLEFGVIGPFVFSLSLLASFSLLFFVPGFLVVHLYELGLGFLFRNRRGLRFLADLIL